jgi:5-methylcytosine-specific restriction endonuclease McrA
MKIRIDPLDTKMSSLVRKMYPVCQACHSASSTQVHHWKGRRHRSVRFDLDNLWAVCFTCHRKFHEDPKFSVDKQALRLGERFNAFILKANSICKRTSEDKKMIGFWIDQQLKMAK